MLGQHCFRQNPGHSVHLNSVDKEIKELTCQSFSLLDNNNIPFSSARTAFSLIIGVPSASDEVSPGSGDNHEVGNANNWHLIQAFGVNTGSLLHILSHKIEFATTSAWLS